MWRLHCLDFVPVGCMNHQTSRFPARALVRVIESLIVSSGIIRRSEERSLLSGMMGTNSFLATGRKQVPTRCRSIRGASLHRQFGRPITLRNRTCKLDIDLAYATPSVLGAICLRNRSFTPPLCRTIVA